MSLLYVRLRGSIYSEAGYCLHAGEIAPRLRKDTAAYFALLDHNGQRTRLERVEGCDGDDPDGAIAIPLTPYAAPERGRALVALMCRRLSKAMAGDRVAREVLGWAWQQLTLSHVCGFAQAPADKQIALLGGFFGQARVSDELNRRGTVIELTKIRPEDMVDEALA